MCHTRELAFQISKEYERFSKFLAGVKVNRIVISCFAVERVNFFTRCQERGGVEIIGIWKDIECCFIENLLSRPATVFVSTGYFIIPAKKIH